MKELSLRIVDLESAATSADPSRNLKRLESRIDELSTQLSKTTREKEEASLNSRKFDRTVRDLQFQLAEREKLAQRQEDELTKTNDKLKKLKVQVTELVRIPS